MKLRSARLLPPDPRGERAALGVDVGQPMRLGGWSTGVGVNEVSAVTRRDIGQDGAVPAVSPFWQGQRRPADVGNAVRLPVLPGRRHDHDLARYEADAGMTAKFL